MGWISAYRQKAELEQQLLPGELSSFSATTGSWRIVAPVQNRLYTLIYSQRNSFNFLHQIDS
jgi:hypothetical protein